MLAELDLAICYQPGRRNASADDLSRAPVGGGRWAEEKRRLWLPW